MIDMTKVRVFRTKRNQDYWACTDEMINRAIRLGWVEYVEVIE